MKKRVLTTGIDDIELLIEREDGQGRGIGFCDGKTVFVAAAMRGERVVVREERAKGRVMRARLVEVLAASPERREPPCPYAATCGGCAMQHMDYARQLAEKAGRVRDCLRRIGRLREDAYEVLPPIGMEEPWRYRNKAVAHIAGGEIGFFAAGSHDLVPIGDCLLQGPTFAKALAVTRAWLREGGEAASLLWRRTRGGEVMAALNTTGDRLPLGGRWAARLGEALPEARSILHGQYVRPDGVARSYAVLRGEPALQDEMLGVTTPLSPGSFRQVNAAQAEALYAAALDLAALTGKERVIDAYCGAGILTQLLAARSARAAGIEIVPAAIEDARASAARNGCGNVEFFLGATEALLPGMRCDVLVLDPPREGCESVAIRAAAETGAAKIVYISCDPATLARDVALLGSGGYRLERVRAVDMFPWTGHVESVAVLGKSG